MNVEIFEGERAINYDDFVETWIPLYHEFVSLLPKLLDSNNVKEVLIAGCGTGNEVKVLAEASSNWNLTGIDPSPEMILQAKQKLASFTNVKLIEGVVDDLGIDKKFDAATLLLVLHFLEDNGDKLALLKSMASKLKPKAPLITYDITGSQNHIKNNIQVLASLLPKDIDKEIIDYRFKRIEQSLHYVSEQRFIELCLEAGFETPIKFFQSIIYSGWLLTKK